MSLILIVKSSMLGLILFMLKKLLELIEFLFDETKKNKTKQNKQTIKRVIWCVITVKSKCSIMMSTISVMTLRYAIVLLQCDVLICYLVLVLWHYAMTFGYFAFAMCWFVKFSKIFQYSSLGFPSVHCTGYCAAPWRTIKTNKTGFLF